MSIEENKKLVRRYCEEVADQGNLDLIDEFLAPDPSYYGPDYLESFKRKRAESRAALSDVSFHIEDMIAEEDKVVVRGTARAIHDRAEWLGMAPTGNRLKEKVIDIFRVQEGKIVQVWSESSGPHPEESPST
jgi:predicted ester cyclase